MRALVRRGEDASELEQLGVEIVEWDLLDPDSFPAAVADQEVIVHTAALVGDWGPYSRYREINVVGLDHLLQAVHREGKLAPLGAAQFAGRLPATTSLWQRRIGTA